MQINISLQAVVGMEDVMIKARFSPTLIMYLG
jgi:hypothetical protein